MFRRLLGFSEKDSTIITNSSIFKTLTVSYRTLDDKITVIRGLVDPQRRFMSALIIL